MDTVRTTRCPGPGEENPRSGNVGARTRATPEVRERQLRDRKMKGVIQHANISMIHRRSRLAPGVVLYGRY